MNAFFGWSLSIVLFTLGMNMPTKASAPKATSIEAAVGIISTPTKVEFVVASETTQPQPALITFSHGDVSWLPQLATEAGWPVETHERLGEIILRESGGCPNRRGGDAVDGDCNITHVTEWNHRSDTGLLQLNGVNYNPKRNKFALACTQLQICTQKPLLDPLNNLKVGYLLYEAAGWGPWDPCTWGKEWAHRCVKSNP